MASGEGPPTSPTLLRQLWTPKNNEEAWRTFLERYGPLIDAWCRQSGLQHADAEEVSAAVRCKLATALRTFEYDPVQRFRGWLKRVVDNAVRDLWQGWKHRPCDRGSGDSGVQALLEQTEAPGAIDSLVCELDESLERDRRLAERATARVRQRVEPHTWQAYWLTAIEGQPAGAVAAKLGMTTAAVYVAKNRVGKMLREEGAKLQAPEACEVKP